MMSVMHMQYLDTLLLLGPSQSQIPRRFRKEVLVENVCILNSGEVQRLSVGRVLREGIKALRSTD